MKQKLCLQNTEEQNNNNQIYRNDYGEKGQTKLEL